MEQVSRPRKIELPKLAWRRFIDMGELMPGVRPAVARSWFRCKKNGLDPYGQPENGLHNTESLDDIMVRFERDKSAINPILQQTLTWLNSEAVLLLIHNSRVIIETLGSLSLPFPALLQKGQLISERIFGTFGPALALQGEEFAEVRGYEHFLASLHPYHSVAVHFFIQDEPWLLGAILPLEQSGPQTIGLLQAAGQILSLKIQPPSPPVYLTDDRQDVIPLEQLERMEIIKALEICAGNITQSALMLGVSRSTLYSRIRKYGIVVIHQA